MHIQLSLVSAACAAQLWKYSPHSSIRFPKQKELMYIHMNENAQAEITLYTGSVLLDQLLLLVRECAVDQVQNLMGSSLAQGTPFRQVPRALSL